MIVGDGACGKTSLLSVFTLGYFPKVSSSIMQANMQDYVCREERGWLM